MIKTCPTCKKEFVSTSNNSMYCSKSCNPNTHINKTFACKHCNKQYKLSKDFHSEYFCRDCFDKKFEITCACGCNTIFKIDIHEFYKGRKYIRGHGRKNRKSTKEHLLKAKTTREINHPKKPTIYKECECGCGKLTKNKHYIHGHNVMSEEAKIKAYNTKVENNSLKCSDEKKAKISEANKGSNNGMYGKHHTDDVKEKISKSSILKWEDATYREKFKISVSDKQKKLTKVEVLARIKNLHPDIILNDFFDRFDDTVCHSSMCNHTWITKPHYLMYGSGCPICHSSKGENRISNFLKLKDIDFQQQKRFTNCRNKKPLPFDFYLKDFNLCIEYDGAQHFEFIEGLHKEEKNFYESLYRDQIKTNYCKDNNINLLRIAYTDYENIETIIENKLEQLKQEK